MAIRNREQQAGAKEARDLALHLARLAVVNHFDAAYGTDVSSWMPGSSYAATLASRSGGSISLCKNYLKGTYINIVDFVADTNAGRPVRTFGSYSALRAYISKQKRAKTFPLAMAKENPILKFMLIKLH